MIRNYSIIRKSVDIDILGTNTSLHITKDNFIELNKLFVNAIEYDIKNTFQKADEVNKYVELLTEFHNLLSEYDYRYYQELSTDEVEEKLFELEKKISIISLK